MTVLTTRKDGPFHEGEVALQSAVGMVERVGNFARRAIRDHMPAQHREFFAQLPFIVMAAVDTLGDVWPTIVAGEPGFMHSPDPRTLIIQARPYRDDPAREGLGVNDAVGLLGIELSTRRRNRLNGTIIDADNTALAIRAEQSFGNCPQYIQLRDCAFARDTRQEPQTPPQWFDVLDERARTLIEAADTLFVGSYVDAASGRQVDVSHRGGKPGFVRIDDDGVLTIPDFAGNFHFNTLGNFVVNPRAGLLFADFETGDLLQLAGKAEVITDSPEIGTFRSAERIWTFRPSRIVLRRGALPLRFKLREDGFSPNSLMTGTWEEAESTLGAERRSRQWRSLRISRIVEETRDIASFYLEPVDGRSMPRHFAGQHLPVRARIDGGSEYTSRSYTLSSAPSDDFHRISVRRQGAFSDWLHARKAGDLLEARAPAGAFHLDGTEKRAAVLIAAGVGVTPMLAMMRQIVFEGLRQRRIRPIWLVHVARSREQRAFHDEIADLVKQAQGAVKFITIHSAPGAGEREGVDYSWQGRFALSDLARFLPFGDHDYYLCGPAGFMQSTYNDLRDMGVADARVHAEAFGPSAIMRRSDTPDAHPPAPTSTQAIRVLFADSAKKAQWEPGSGTLLELAEQSGLSPQFSCRTGTCGACVTRLSRGTITYPHGITANVKTDEILLCSAVPAEGSTSLEIDL